MSSYRPEKLFRLVIVVLVAALAVSLSLTPACAEDLKGKKQKYRSIQSEIKKQQEKLKRTREVEASTFVALDETNRKLHATRQKINRYRAKLKETEKNIKKISSEISALRKKLERRRQWISRKLRAMHRYGRYGDTILMLVASEDATDLMKRWHYLKAIARYESGLIEDYRSTLAELNSKEAKLEDLHEKLVSEEKRVRKSERNLAMDKEEKQQILAAVKRKRASYENMLRELNAASQELQKMIKQAERQKQVASKGFWKLKGQLPWPVKGNVAIPYGAQKDPTYNTPVFRNGIYIAAPEGTYAKAVHSGKVVYADWFKNYGQLIILNHGGGYHSLYANLSEIFLKEGDIINNRANIGRVGDSSVIDRPSLYFEIRYKGKPLNPAQWLKGK